SYYNPNKLYFRDILELKSKKIFNLFYLFFTPTSSLFKTSNNF
ncbi:antibiotic acetyltransferase, partial [Campylobacter jejuni]|nr:antibiotic acetyltransferase [Campylobacter jejuni]